MNTDITITALNQIREQYQNKTEAQAEKSLEYMTKTTHETKNIIQIDAKEYKNT